jgi:sugar lactone lactonase YvrE
MRTRALVGLALAAGTALGPAVVVPAAAASEGPSDRPVVYQLPGDTAAPGSKFEGIGYDRRSHRFYVSETTGGEIARGDVRRPSAAPWLDGNGTDGRFTARGVNVDDQGRVYIAGGPNGIDHPGAPDLWVYSPQGTLLAALQTGVDSAFLNDIAIGKDGAAYFTNSNAPQIFRVAEHNGTWSVTTFVDATGTIPTSAGFNLGGIVATPDGKALLVAQGNVGRLWRVDLSSRTVTEVPTGGADLVNADGLVLRGRELTAIRNFSRRLTTVRVDGDWSTVRPVADVPTDPDRVLTTGKIADGRLLAVDSKFDEPVATPPYQVVVLRLP